MRLLLDTHVLLWSLAAPERLGRRALADIENPANLVMFSAASIWEIAIKAALRRPDFDVDPYEVLSEASAIGFTELAISSHAAAAVRDLPPYHQDPFDRLLVAQALSEPALLLTADSKLQPYSDLVRLI
jgi:PIN domain nuclease of toxin-antitoxin system